MNPRNCCYCEQEFEPKNAIQRYCSKLCWLGDLHPSRLRTKLICPNCKQDFKPKPSQRYCSQFCTHQARRIRLRRPRACRHCKQDFTAYRGNQRYCSQRCGNIARRRRTLPGRRSCLLCKTRFKPFKGNHRYCCRFCRDVARPPRPYQPVVYVPRPCLYCQKIFTPVNRTQLYCSKNHGEMSRRRRAPEIAKAQREKTKQWRKDNPEKWRAIQRRAYDKRAALVQAALQLMESENGNQ